MAHKKRKHHSRKHHSDGMHYDHDRMGHVDGEHRGSEKRGMMVRGGFGGAFKERMDLNDRRRIMETNNGNMGPIREDFSRPCGIPYGAISRDLGNGNYYSMNAYRAGDLYEQVDATMREDAAAIKSITKPTNW
jgi:hypothetical protein